MQVQSNHMWQFFVVAFFLYSYHFIIYINIFLIFWQMCVIYMLKWSHSPCMGPTVKWLQTIWEEWCITNHNRTQQSVWLLQCTLSCLLGVVSTITTRTPAFWGYPPPPHDYPYHWVILDPKSKEDKVKVTNLKNSPKFQNFKFLNGHYTQHTFSSCLIRCANMKWIGWVLLKIQSGQDSVHRRTDGRTDGQGDTSIPPYQLRWSGGYNDIFKLLNLRALKISTLYTNCTLQCMGEIFCVEFQRYPLKFHTKYLTHTLKDEDFIHMWKCKSS